MPGLNPVAFAKCAPSIGTNIRQCGTVTVCDAAPITADEYDSLFKKNDRFRVLNHLFHHDFEIRMCEAEQNGLYEFLMANSVNMQKKIAHERKDGMNRIRPFVYARQYSPINNKFWRVSGGHTSGSNWVVTLHSSGNIPSNIESFPERMSLFISAKSSGGSATRTAWEIVGTPVLDGSGGVQVTLSSLNLGSNLSAAKLQAPIVGVATRGTPNVSDFESWCNEMPAYLNWKDVPFFFGTYRDNLCGSSEYDQWREMVLENGFYREYVDLPEVEKNKQIGKDWQARVVEQFFWSKARRYQNVNQFDQLEDISAFDPADVGLDGIGIGGGHCVGKRADPSGVYEQMAECNRIVDLQGDQLNLPAIFKELYHMMRAKSSAGSKNPMVFDFFTDNVTAKNFTIAWVNYMNFITGGAFRVTDEFGPSKSAQFGFMYKSYTLDYPQGVTINIVTHFYFDDMLSAMAESGSNMEQTVRSIWILDFAGIYAGVIATNSTEDVVGKRENLAKLSRDAACTMRMNTQTIKNTSLTMTVVVECPMANLIIENFSSAVPNHLVVADLVYPSATTTTTSTTPAPYTG